MENHDGTESSEESGVRRQVGSSAPLSGRRPASRPPVCPAPAPLTPEVAAAFAKVPEQHLALARWLVEEKLRERADNALHIPALLADYGRNAQNISSPGGYYRNGGAAWARILTISGAARAQGAGRDAKRAALTAAKAAVSSRRGQAIGPEDVDLWVRETVGERSDAQYLWAELQGRVRCASADPLVQMAMALWAGSERQNRSSDYFCRHPLSAVERERIHELAKDAAAVMAFRDGIVAKVLMSISYQVPPQYEGWLNIRAAARNRVAA
jgi:hypothetical protein